MQKSTPSKPLTDDELSQARYEQEQNEDHNGPNDPETFTPLAPDQVAAATQPAVNQHPAADQTGHETEQLHQHPAADYEHGEVPAVDVVTLTGDDLIEALMNAGYIYLRDGVLVCNFHHSKADQYIAVDLRNLAGLTVRGLKKLTVRADPDKELRAELSKVVSKAKGKTEQELWKIFQEQVRQLSTD